MKQFIKRVLQKLGFDLTLNMKYDRQTERVIRKVLRNDSCSVDVGCHKGEMLEKFIKLAPAGKHFAFEPIPSFYEQLRSKFASDHCTVYPYALAAESGTTEFNYVKNAPAYSGIKQRRYAVEKPDIEKIKVELKPLDEVIDPQQKIDLIKIDVEGAELGVLKGAAKLIRNSQPVIIFECGLGAADFYGTQPEDVFDLLHNNYGLKVSTMERWLKSGEAFSRDAFCETFQKGKDYYFIAYP